MVVLNQLKQLGLELRLLNGELKFVKSQLEEELKTTARLFKDFESEMMDPCNELDVISKDIIRLINELIIVESQISEITRTKEGISQIYYEKTKTNWEKLFGQVGNEVRLLREDKQKTTVTFSTGHALVEDISDTDILTQGLHLFMTEGQDTKKVELPSLSILLASLQIDECDLEIIKSQLIELKQTADRNTRLCEMLKNSLKNLLGQKKKLRTENKILEAKVLFLQNQISEHPTQQEIAAMASEIISLKRKVPVLNEGYLKIITSRQNLRKALRSRQQYRYTINSTLREKLNKLIEDNLALQQILKDVNNEAGYVASQLNVLADLFSRIYQLKELVNALPTDLDNRISHLFYLDNEMALEIHCLQEMASQLSLIQHTIQELQSQFDSVSTCSSAIEHNIQEMKNEIMELLKIFTSVSGKLCHSHLEDDKVKKEGECKEILEALTREKKDIESTLKYIKMLETEVQKLPRPDASYRYPKCCGKDKLCWNDKFVSILGSVEELEILAKEATLCKDKDRLENIMNRYRILLEKEAEESNGHMDHERYRMARSFQSSYDTQGNLYTLSGKDVLTHSIRYANVHQEDSENNEKKAQFTSKISNPQK